jgi:formate hydrogenlyase subunit 3/multisubunit Na+/H+ antiporter MnhD subunit
MLLNPQKITYAISVLPLILALLAIQIPTLSFFFALAFLLFLCCASIFFIATHQTSVDINELYFNILDLTFLAMISAIILVSLLFYKTKITQQLNKNQQNKFYIIILLNIFSIIGIITTNNLLYLYAFIEIYSICFIAIIALDNGKKAQDLNIYNYLFHATTSVLLVFCLFFLYILFDDSNLGNSWHNLRFSSKNWLPSLLFALFTILIMLKFMPMWQYFYKIKIKSPLLNIFLIDSIFIRSLVAIFLLIKLIYSIFSWQLFFENYWFSKILLLTGSALSIYASFRIVSTNHLKLATIFLAMSTIGLIISSINIYSLNNGNSFIFLLCILFVVNFILFLLADLAKNGCCNYFIKLLLYLLIFQLLSIPASFYFFANWFMLLNSFTYNLSLILIFVVAINNAAQIILAHRLFLLTKQKTINKIDNWQFSALGLAFLFSILLMLNINSINIIGDNILNF